ncbi:hypothetical protein EDM21_12375 [Paenibacillus sp. N10]|uniref:Uncharacterized protein n=1 Tax=Paenibacillus lutrae TaxID=2078573 RepID=A0A7X3JZR7_9BACL|nr:hypothetical protein [Paenibacillus lutrae]
MANAYKVRATCESQACKYVQPQDVIRAVNYESSYAMALMLNDIPGYMNCPLCGSALHFYPFALIQDVEA